MVSANASTTAAGSGGDGLGAARGVDCVEKAPGRHQRVVVREGEKEEKSVCGKEGGERSKRGEVKDREEIKKAKREREKG